MTNKYLKELPNILIITIMFVVGILVYPHLPAKVPSHWNFRGEIDGYTGSFGGAFMLPLMTLGIYLFISILPFIDPRKENYAKFTDVFDKIRYILTGFFAVLYFATLGAALGYLQDVSSIVIFCISALFMLMGNYFGKIRQNYFIGIRVPWTIADEDVWNRTHRLAGKLWFLAGVLGILGAFLPRSIGGTLFFGAITIGTLVPIAYSYKIFRDKQRH